MDGGKPLVLQRMSYGFSSIDVFIVCSVGNIHVVQVASNIKVVSDCSGNEGTAG